MKKYPIPKINYRKKEQREFEKMLILKNEIEQTEIQKHIINQTTAYTTEAILAILCISLKDEFGFGNKRLSNLINKFNANLKCVQAGTVSIDDFILWYRKEIKPNLMVIEDE